MKLLELNSAEGRENLNNFWWHSHGKGRVRYQTQTKMVQKVQKLLMFQYRGGSCTLYLNTGVLYIVEYASISVHLVYPKIEYYVVELRNTPRVPNKF